MYPAKFDYYRAASVQEAIQLLQDHEDAKLLAGGHSLIPAMKLRLAQPPAIIDIGRIAELKGVSHDNGSIKIGALTVHADVAASNVLKSNCPLLAEAASNVGDRQVRHKGTIGGNIAHADPASDMPAAILALGGTIHLIGPSGSRQVAAADFFIDLLATDLHEDELLTAIEVPAQSGKTGSCYLKFEHPASGYAVCGAAAVVTLNDDGACAGASLCFNGVTATPHNATASPTTSPSPASAPAKPKPPAATARSRNARRPSNATPATASGVSWKSRSPSSKPTSKKATPAKPRSNPSSKTPPPTPTPRSPSPCKKNSPTSRPRSKSSQASGKP